MDVEVFFLIDTIWIAIILVHKVHGEDAKETEVPGCCVPVFSLLVLLEDTLKNFYLSINTLNMTRQGLIFFLLIHMLVLSTSGQQVIKGLVQDKSTALPLKGATIVLNPGAPDSMAAVTDSAGSFQFPWTQKPVSQKLQASFIGYLPMEIEINHSDSVYVLALSPSPEFLTTVMVTATSVALRYGLDKQVYHVGNDLQAQTGTLTDVLQNIPSITVDIDGGVSLRNSSNITFFIDGRPSTLFRGNLAAALEQIPAHMIERIEIITNPSAKYRPDGVGGIINIVMKKDVKEGFGGQLSLNAGSENRYNANLSLSYGTRKTRLHTAYGYRHFEALRFFREERMYKDSASGTVTGNYRDDGRRKTNRDVHSINGGFSWRPDKYNSLEISGNISFERSVHKGYALVGQTASGQPQYQFNNFQRNDEDEEDAEASIQYEHLFRNKEDHSLGLEITHGSFREKEDQQFLQQYTFPSYPDQLRHILVEKSGRQNEVLLDYALPLGEDRSFESGYAGEYIHEDIRYVFENSSRFILNQQVHAFYGLYEHGFDALSFKAGLRFETATLRPRLKSPVEAVSINRYSNFFPTLHVQYELNDDHTFSASYSKRINRPDADELNPNLEYSDPRNAEGGNPFIQPEKTHAFELGHRATAGKMAINHVIYYRHSFDAFTSIRKKLNDTVVLTTLQNLSRQNSTGLESVLTWQDKKWSADLTGNVFHTRLKADPLTVGQDNSGITGNIKMNVQLKPWKQTAVQLNAFYYFPSITPQGRRYAYHYLNGGLRQQLAKGRLSLSFTVTDVFYTNRIHGRFKTIDLEQQTWRRRRGPIILFGISWRFRNFKAEEKLQFEQDAG